MMFAPGQDARDRYEAIERRERRRRLVRRIIFDSLGVALIALICTSVWWLR